MSTERVRVGEVLQLQRRAVDVDPSSEYAEIGVRSFGKGIFHKESVLGSDLGSKRVFRIEPSDLVLSNVFAWEGAIAVASLSDAGRIGSHRFMTYTPRDDGIDPSWAAWFFLSEPGLALIRSASPGSAGRNRTLAIDRFENLEIPLPPIEEQRRVAARLDHARANASVTVGRLRAFSSSDWAVEIPLLTGAILEQEGVGQRPVGDLVDFVSDTVHPGEDPGAADRFIGLQHVESHTGRRIGSDPLGSMKGRKFRFRAGDVVYGYLRPYLNKAWVADCDGLCSVDQYVLRPRPGVDPVLVGYLLRSQGVLSAAIELTHSLQLPRLRSGLLSGILVPGIPEDQTASVVSRMDSIRSLVIQVAELRAQQVSLAEALLPSALNEAFADLS